MPEGRVRDYRLWRACTLFSGSLPQPIMVTGRFGGPAPRESLPHRKPGYMAFHFRDPKLALLVIPDDTLTTSIDDSVVRYRFAYVHVTFGVGLVHVVDPLAAVVAPEPSGAPTEYSDTDSEEFG